uniref:Uroplakin 3B n=1 Tax=Podarcis muralis TaxID=64176 RepID=A0A670JX34_PODMU
LESICSGPQNEQLASFSRCLSLVSVGYTPRLTSKDLAGKITSSTFTLEQPRCVFNKFVTATDEIWLLVARSSGTLCELPYQSFENNSCYMTLGTAPANYPCPAEESSKLTVLRVGNEVDCKTDPARPDCNGPLPEPGPYRVKFLAFNSGGPIAESRWSDPITLIQDPSVSRGPLQMPSNASLSLCADACLSLEGRRSPCLNLQRPEQVRSRVPEGTSGSITEIICRSIASHT